MPNIILVGIVEDELKQIGLLLSRRLDYFYYNCEEMIEYSLIDGNKMKEICGENYFLSQEKKVIFQLNGYERTIATLNVETFFNNKDAISNSNLVIYLRQTKGQIDKKITELKEKPFDNSLLINKLELNQLVFNERDNFLKKNCNFSIKYDISKLDDLIDSLQSIAVELK